MNVVRRGIFDELLYQSEQAAKTQRTIEYVELSEREMEELKRELQAKGLHVPDRTEPNSVLGITIKRMGDMP